MTSPADVYPQKPLGKNDIERNKFFVVFFLCKIYWITTIAPGYNRSNLYQSQE